MGQNKVTQKEKKISKSDKNKESIKELQQKKENLIN